MKLSEFRLETYDERWVLIYALQVIRGENELPYQSETIDALLTRLSLTQCQSGGCQYCGEDVS